jgi:hypothetical protein
MRAMWTIRGGQGGLQWSHVDYQGRAGRATLEDR